MYRTSRSRTVNLLYHIGIGKQAFEGWKIRGADVEESRENLPALASLLM